MAGRNYSFPLAARFSRRLCDKSWFAVPVLTLLLLSPTLLHGQPFLFWDTGQYYHYGAQLVGFAAAKVSPTMALSVSGRSETPKESGLGSLNRRSDGKVTTTFDRALIARKSAADGMATYGNRSPFFSIWLYSAAWTFNLWGVLIAQAATTAWIIWRAVSHAAGALRFEVAVAIVVLGTFGAGAWFVVGFVMPDIYAAFAVICVALLFAYADRMSLPERMGHAAILTVSAAFHATHLVVAVVLTLLGIGATNYLGSVGRLLRRRALLAIASALGIALALQIAFDTTARAVLGAAPKRPPLLTARLIADGPGRLYLDSACPAGAAFLVCGYRSQTFNSADEFLWSAAGLFQSLSVEQRLRLIEEEPRFVAAVAMRYPSRVLKAAVYNAIEQFVLVWPSEAWIDPGATFGDPAWSGAGLFQVAPFLGLCVDNLGKCVPVLPEAFIAASVAITVFLSLCAISVHFVAARHPKIRVKINGCAYERAIIFAFLILMGLVANAGICGAISGPHTRYQARVVWLAILAAGVLEATHPMIVSWLRCEFLAQMKRSRGLAPPHS